MLVVAPASARGVADLRQLGWLHKGMRRDGRAEPGQTVCLLLDESAAVLGRCSLYKAIQETSAAD